MDIIAVEGVEADILAKAAAVECGSSHPLAAAIVEAAETRGVDLPKVFGGAMAIPGKAVTARLREGFVSVGSPRPAAEQVRSEERRVGKECVSTGRSRWWPSPLKNKKEN